jgi:hypothetical protein
MVTRVPMVSTLNVEDAQRGIVTLKSIQRLDRAQHVTSWLDGRFNLRPHRAELSYFLMKQEV